MKSRTYENGRTQKKSLSHNFLGFLLRREIAPTAKSLIFLRYKLAPLVIRPHDSKPYGKGEKRWLKGITRPRTQPGRWKSGGLNPRVPRSHLQNGPIKLPA